MTFLHRHGSDGDAFSAQFFDSPEECQSDAADTMLFQTAEDAGNAENLFPGISATSVLSAVQKHKFCGLSILNRGAPD